MNAVSSQLRRGAVMAVALVTFFALLPEAAEASTRVCRQLEAELAGSRTAPQSSKTDAAIAKQSAQLKAAKRQARASGCGFRIFGKGSSSCGALNAKVDGLERSLASLQRKRPANASGRSRAQLLDALQANGCRGDQTASVGGPRSLLQKIFGGGIPQRNIVEDVGPSPGRTTKQARRSIETTNGDGMRFSAPPGRYRTLCVRSCDGYYFPLSTSSRPSDFARDQANCQTSCPGTEAQIYYTQPDSEADTMVSGISGRAYTDLPAAWLYKQVGVSAPEGCSCTAQRNGTLAQSAAPSGEKTAALPAAAGPAAPSPIVEPRDNEERSADRPVRVVGPVFLPDPEGAADPQVPAPSEGQ